MKTKKKKSWIKGRHKLGKFLVLAYTYPKLKNKYRVKLTPFKDRKRQYLVLFNHQTGYDQFFVGKVFFKHPIYFVASEDILSMGKVSKIISYLVAPVPIKKQTTDTSAVLTCARIVKEGGSIAIAPEGNRTFSGETAFIKESIVKFIRLLKLPVAFFIIEGGYGVQPRWSDVVRRGGLKAGVKKVLEYDEYKDLTDEQLYSLVKSNLYVDETLIQKEYKHKKSAEYLERAIYVCPKCGLTTFYSKNDWIICSKCGKKVQYLPNKELRGVGNDFSFSNVKEWYNYQCDYINALDLTPYYYTPAYVDNVKFARVRLYKDKVTISKKAQIKLFGDKITITDRRFGMLLSFNRVSTVTVLGKNKLNVYVGDSVYQIKGDKRFNALRYVNFYHRYKQIKGEITDDFLGL